jgi:predicted DNA-binding protein
MSKSMDKKTISVVLNRETYDRLVSYCEKNETKVSPFVRKIIKQTINC